MHPTIYGYTKSLAKITNYLQRTNFRLWTQERMKEDHDFFNDVVWCDELKFEQYYVCGPCVSDYFVSDGNRWRFVTIDDGLLAIVVLNDNVDHQDLKVYHLCDDIVNRSRRVSRQSCWRVN
ncbi:hypothetical protein J6590_064897 [Homalodisca vitripennis]|nr:hypothetical protein J6590_064897 [Homalodisca vitripennis]